MAWPAGHSWGLLEVTVRQETCHRSQSSVLLPYWREKGSVGGRFPLGTPAYLSFSFLSIFWFWALWNFSLKDCIGFFPLNNFNELINFWLCWTELCWVFTAVKAFLQLWWVGATLWLQCSGFSLWWFLLLRSTGFRVCGLRSCSLRALEHRLSSCGAWASLLSSV